MKLIRWSYALLAAVLVISACSEDPEDPGNGGGNNTFDVRLLAQTFSPATRTISVGQTIRWVNDQAIAHNVTPANPQQAGVWTARNLTADNENFSHTFNTAGTFNYSCTVHPGMNGIVTVNP